MSGLAKYLLELGYKVSGSDTSENKYTKQLQTMGATIYIGHDSDYIDSDMTIVASTAIKETNPEVVKAKELGLKIHHRSDILELISGGFGVILGILFDDFVESGHGVFVIGAFHVLLAFDKGEFGYFNCHHLA